MKKKNKSKKQKVFKPILSRPDYRVVNRSYSIASANVRPLMENGDLIHAHTEEFVMQKCCIDSKYVIRSTITDAIAGYLPVNKKLISTYLSMHKSFDQTLNIYSDSLSKSFDVYDFTNYDWSKGDYAKDAITKNFIDNKPMVRYLWTSAEYTHIIKDASTDYYIHRVDYDKDSQEVKYNIAIYVKAYAVEGVVIQIPLFLMEASVFYTEIEGFKINTEACTFSRLKTLAMTIEKTSTTSDMLQWLLSSSQIPLNQENVIATDMIRAVYQKLYDMGATVSSEYASPIIHVLYINDQLAHRRVSKPKPTGIEVSYVDASGEERIYKQTVCKVGEVTVHSNGRPKLFSDERIIHYYTPEWDVRGFWRKTPSGKEIYIDPQVRRRRKINLSGGQPNVDSPKTIIVT